jgi:hypothetical protein
MIQKVAAPVSLVFSFNHRSHTVSPQKILWNGREYIITKVGLHHTFRDGLTLYHIFSVASNSLFFRLSLNTDNLFWTLEEISDGLPA